jgi:hypothetical protein
VTHHSLSHKQSAVNEPKDKAREICQTTKQKDKMELQIKMTHISC